MTKEELAEVRAVVLAALVDYEGFKKNRRNQAVKKAFQGTIAATALGGAGFSLAHSDRETPRSAYEERRDAPGTVQSAKADESGDVASYRQEQTVKGAVHFSFGSRTLALAHKERLDLLVEQLPKGAELTVVGHTDASGNRAYNYKLGKLRALSVAKYLSQKGVKVKMIGSKGESEESSGWMARRVDVVMTYSAPEAIQVNLPPLLEPAIHKQARAHLHSAAKLATLDSEESKPAEASGERVELTALQRLDQLIERRERLETLQREKMAKAQPAAKAEPSSHHKSAKVAEERVEHTPLRHLDEPSERKESLATQLRKSTAKAQVEAQPAAEAGSAPQKRASTPPSQRDLERYAAAAGSAESRPWSRLVLNDKLRISDTRLARMRPVAHTPDVPRGSGAGDSD